MSNIFRKQGINTGSGGGSIDTSTLANKTDLTAIILTGTTNTSEDVISAGTWFYLNGKPCIAKVDIASGATFTEGTNYEKKTIGSALSELNRNNSNVYQFTVAGTQPITLNIDSIGINLVIVGRSTSYGAWIVSRETLTPLVTPSGVTASLSNGVLTITNTNGDYTGTLRGFRLYTSI